MMQKKVLIVKRKRGRSRAAPLTEDRVRLNLVLPTDLKNWLQDYASRRNTTITALIVHYFGDLRAEDETPDVRQI